MIPAPNTFLNIITERSKMINSILSKIIQITLSSNLAANPIRFQILKARTVFESSFAINTISTE